MRFKKHNYPKNIRIEFENMKAYVPKKTKFKFVSEERGYNFISRLIIDSNFFYVFLHIITFISLFASYFILILKNNFWMLGITSILSFLCFAHNLYLIIIDETPPEKFWISMLCIIISIISFYMFYTYYIVMFRTL